MKTKINYSISLLLVLMLSSFSFLAAMPVENEYQGRQNDPAKVSGLQWVKGGPKDTAAIESMDLILPKIFSFGSLFNGQNAGSSNAMGFDNTFMGFNAGTNNLTGYDNTFIGKNAGTLNRSGSANTFIGRASGESNLTGIANTFIGRDAGSANTIGNANTFIGRGAGSFHQAGDNNTFIGREAGLMNFTGKGNVFIGHQAGYNEMGNNLLIINNNADRTPLITGDFESGKVGINRYASMHTLEINGNAFKSTAGNWLGNTDERQMKNVNYLNSQEMLNKVLQMKGVQYEWDQNTNASLPQGAQYGFTGQELQKVWPEKVKADENGMLQAAYGDYDPVIVEAIKALNAKIERLEAENEMLKSENSQMTAQLKEVTSLKADMEQIKKLLGGENR